MESSPSPPIFIGTYTKTGSRGIYATRLDSAGALSAPALAGEASNPTFLALSPGRKNLYAVRDSPAMAAAYAVDPAAGLLRPLAPVDPPAGPGPCHAAVDRSGRALILTNFHTGIVAALPIRAEGTLGAPRTLLHAGRGPHPTRQASAHPHSSTIAPDNRFALVCDLGLDRIFTYRLDPERAALAPAATPFAAAVPGSGPRHAVFGPDGRRVYVINEIANTIALYDYDDAGGALAPGPVVSTLPADFSGESSAAEIALHPNGRFIYGSNRGHDSLALFSVDRATGALALLECVPCGGRGPRSFALSPDGAWLVCAHQNSDSLSAFRVDGATGRLTRTGDAVGPPAPVCVGFA